MFARVTLLEIDTMRMDVDDAVELFRERVLPDLRAEPGFEGIHVLRHHLTIFVYPVGIDSVNPSL